MASEDWTGHNEINKLFECNFFVDLSNLINLDEYVEKTPESMGLGTADRQLPSSAWAVRSGHGVCRFAVSAICHGQWLW
jgi:hypothetical protein